MTAPLSGRTALVVEDEALVGILIKSMLEELGCSEVRLARTLKGAAEAVASKAYDFAVLDINIDGAMVFPIARDLAERGAPIVFSTGYGRSGLTSEWTDYPVLRKPYGVEELKAVLLSALETAKPDPPGPSTERDAR